MLKSELRTMAIVSIENKRAHKDIERKQLLISITVMQRNYFIVNKELFLNTKRSIIQFVLGIPISFPTSINFQS